MDLLGRTRALGRPCCGAKPVSAKPVTRVYRCAPVRAAQQDLEEEQEKSERLAKGWKILAPLLDALASDLKGQEVHLDYSTLSGRDFVEVSQHASVWPGNVFL